MCTNRKYIRNQYTGQRIIVPCGKCDACKQAKANRVAQRIRSSIPDGFVGIFAGLTYEEKYIPYIKKQDLYNNELDTIPIYRDVLIRHFGNRLIEHRLKSSIGTIDIVDKETGEICRDGIRFHPNLWSNKTHSFHKEKMGIIYYKDAQDFFKRLRTNLSRDQRYTVPTIRFFCTSEYGETKYRPHFHILVITEKDNYDIVKSAIVKSWPFEDRNLLERNIEPARDVASYVASYVNSGSDFPEVFARLSRPKHSQSKNFGVELPAFRLPKILENADKGDMSYNRAATVNGVPAVFTLPIPKYVINRYFPQFKGLCRLSPDTLDLALRESSSFFEFRRDNAIQHYGASEKDGKIILDSHVTAVRLNNAFKKYHSLTGRNRFDFAIDYQRVWNCYKNTVYRMMFDDIDEPMLQKYDNIEYVVKGSLRNDTLQQLINDSKQDIVTDFNCFRKRKEITDKLSLEFQRKKKNAKVNNLIYSQFSNL